MNTSPKTNRRLLPFEADVLTAVRDVLPAVLVQRFDAQVEAINHVQRLLNWREIEFYRKHWFRVQWPESALFDFRDEQRLATVDCAFADHAVQISVWAVGGHLFSLEAGRGLKPIHKAEPFKVSRAEVQVFF